MELNEPGLKFLRKPNKLTHIHFWKSSDFKFFFVHILFYFVWTSSIVYWNRLGTFFAGFSEQSSSFLRETLVRSTLTLLQIWSQVFPRYHWSLWRRNAVFQFLFVAASFWSSFFERTFMKLPASIAFFELTNHHLFRPLSKFIRIPQWTQNCLYKTKKNFTLKSPNLNIIKLTEYSALVYLHICVSGVYTAQRTIRLSIFD